jgi:hypothetical protein
MTLPVLSNEEQVPRVQIYVEAVRVIDALCRRCEASSDSYLLGSIPCSLDARVYGLLVYIAAADTIAPVLKDALQRAPALQKYVARISERHFGVPAPLFEEGNEVGGWSAAGSGAVGEEEKQPETVEEKRERRRSWWWLGGVAAVMLGYAVFGGRYVEFAIVEQESEQEAEGES